MVLGVGVLEWDLTVRKLSSYCHCEVRYNRMNLILFMGNLLVMSSPAYQWRPGVVGFGMAARGCYRYEYPAGAYVYVCACVGGCGGMVGR